MRSLIACALVAAAAPTPPPIIDPAIATIADRAHDAPDDAAARTALDAQLAAATDAAPRAALAVLRARLVEERESAGAALDSLRGLRPPGLLAAALGDERLRLARAAGRTAVVLKILKARLGAAPDSKRGRALELQIADLGLAAEAAAGVERARDALAVTAPADLTSLLEARRELLKGNTAKGVEKTKEAIDLAKDGHARQRIDDLVKERGLTATLVKSLGRRPSLAWCARLAEAGRAESAEAILDLLGEADDLLPVRLRVRVVLRDYAGALAAADAILAQPPGGAHPAAAHERARMLARLGRPREASQAYATFAATYKDDPKAEKASFMAAWLYHEAGRSEEAARRFAKYVKAAPGAAMAPQARWLWAFNLYRAGELEPALAALDDVLQRTADGERKVQASYFKARALARLGRTAEARALLDALVAARLRPLERAPYYRALARAALERLEDADTAWAGVPRCSVGATVEGAGGAAALHLITEPPADIHRRCREPLRAAVEQLAPHLAPAARAVLGATASAGLCDVSARVLRSVPRPSDPAGERAYLEASASAGDATRTLRRAARGYRRVLEEPYSDQRRWMWRLAYPAPPFFAPLGRRDYDVSLLFAIGRHESHFIPDAVSPVGALGVMQVMPATGARLGQLFDVPVASPDALLEPERNIALASRYVGMLWQEFDGGLPLVAASYNGGPQNVTRWLRIHHALPLDEFVESIPFRETRGYVKKVLSAYTVYRRLDGHPNPEDWARRACLDPFPAHNVEF